MVARAHLFSTHLFGLANPSKVVAQNGQYVTSMLKIERGKAQHKTPFHLQGSEHLCNKIDKTICFFLSRL
jgi:hypothetical protein